MPGYEVTQKINRVTPNRQLVYPQSNFCNFLKISNLHLICSKKPDQFDDVNPLHSRNLIGRYLFITVLYLYCFPNKTGNKPDDVCGTREAWLVGALTVSVLFRLMHGYIFGRR